MRFGVCLGYHLVLEDVVLSRGSWSQHWGCGIEQHGVGCCVIPS